MKSVLVLSLLLVLVLVVQGSSHSLSWLVLDRTNQLEQVPRNTFLEICWLLLIISHSSTFVALPDTHRSSALSWGWYFPDNCVFIFFMLLFVPCTLSIPSNYTICVIFCRRCNIERFQGKQRW
jgi:hypothetical protein